jgi:hypothetical protein
MKLICKLASLVLLVGIGSGCGTGRTSPKASSTCDDLVSSNDRLRSGEFAIAETFLMTFSASDSTTTLRGDRLAGAVWVFRTSTNQSDAIPDTVNWALQTPAALYEAPPVTGSTVPEVWSLWATGPSPRNFLPLPDAVEACKQGNARRDADGTFRFDPPLTKVKVSSLRVAFGSDEAEAARLAKAIGAAEFCEASRTNCQIGLPGAVSGS